MHYTADTSPRMRRRWRLSYEDVRGLIRGLAGHLSRKLQRPLELSYFCIMESSAKRACRVCVCVRARAYVCTYTRTEARWRAADVSRVAENNATCRKTRLRPRRDFVRKIIRRANFPRGFGSGEKVTTVYRTVRFILRTGSGRGRSINDVIKIGEPGNYY